MVSTDSLPDFTWLPDLALRPLGGAVIWANDETFAEKENLINQGPATFRPASFGHKGQVYDGWETSRRRDDGNDWVHIRLAGPGVVRMAEIDTSYFIGNSPGAAKLTALAIDGEWIELLPRTELLSDTRHRFLVDEVAVVSEARLDIYPDGGLARLRMFGDLA